MTESREKALLVGVSGSGALRASAETSLEELGLLAQAAGARVVGSVLQERARRDPATLIGRGKVEEIARLCEERDVDLVLFDDELSPAQQRNLEDAVGRKTLDRTQLILDIFARRARTREGRLQVELAQLDYLLPRLTGRGVLLSRLGGGIGTRGPGETKLETDRRRIRQRIQAVRREIARVRRERTTRRVARRRAATPIVALVGYTNAGKSSLFSALTRSAAPASDQLFLTLDPLVRKARLGPSRGVLLVDTVGFIQKLPHGLVDAFRATLEEVVEADLLLHVADASVDDAEEREHAVELVLREIGASEKKHLLVFNKADLTPPPRARALLDSRPGSLLVSARTGEGLPEIRQELLRRLDLATHTVELGFAAGDRRAISAVYASGRVLAHEEEAGRVRLTAELPDRLLARYRENLL